MGGKAVDTVNEPNVRLIPPPFQPPSPAACENVAPQPGSSAGAETCNTVNFETWALAVEWEAADSGLDYWFPMILPNPDGGSDVATSDMGVGLSLRSGDDGSQRGWFPTSGHADASPVSFARSGAGTAIATWLEPPESGVQILRTWAESGNLTVDSERMDDLGGIARWLDVDADGVPEVVGHNLSMRQNGATLSHIRGHISFNTASSANGDFDGDGRTEIASTQGIWDPLTGELTPWAGLSEYTFHGAPVLLDGQIALMGTDGSGAFRATPTGEVLWRLPLRRNDEDQIAIGDVDGDGVPEMAVYTYDAIFVVDKNGVILWTVGAQASGVGSLVMADLDADARQEIIAFGPSGIQILQGATGVILGEDTGLYNTSAYASPAIADVDQDGSAEIVVVGQIRDTETYALRVYGPSRGSWARTRPVWNELDYDVTTIQDDGRLAVWPIPSWESYNSFRAQPAHDGVHPDLTVTATDLCCDADTVQLAVQPSNLGSVDALAGAMVTLSTNDGGGWRAVATRVLDEGIDAHVAASGFVFEVPRADWGSLQVVQITGTDGDECDFVNDRVQIELTCAD